MPDVSVPPTHPDDELVTRKILREELSKYPTKEELREELAKALSNYPTKEELATSFAKYDELIAGRFKGFEDSIRSSDRAAL